jgi:hypothetical protein
MNLKGENKMSILKVPGGLSHKHTHNSFGIHKSREYDMNKSEFKHQERIQEIDIKDEIQKEGRNKQTNKQ